MIPMELMTMLGSGLLAGVMTLWGKSLEAKRESHKMMLEGMAAEGKLVAAARKFNSPGVQFTRRVIALTAVFSIIVWPKLVAVFWPDVGVTIGWTEWDPAFLFIEGSNVTSWKQVTGLVITPLDTHLMTAIVGLYFGASVVKNAR
jgi:hypothetical protein